MSAISRFAPSVVRSAFLQQQRQMASATSVSDPVQKLFVDKIREFKSSNKGLDEAHRKAMDDEMIRLRRVYQVEDEAKLARFDHKFPSEHNVNLHDIDDAKELRHKIHTGEFQKQLATEQKRPSELLATIPDQTPQDMHLPTTNKPSYVMMHADIGVPSPMQFGESVPDYYFVGDKMTPERLEERMLVKFGDEMPTIHDDKAPERDVVNFPRLPQPLDTPPTRYHIIPESWFKFFYPKTGVTGPYTLAATLGTFLLSKEWLIVEHEFLTACSTTIIFTWAITKFGPKVSSWLNNQVKKECDDWDTWRLGNIKALKHIQEHYKNQSDKSGVIQALYDIRHQDVEAQLEAEYRNRVKTVYDDAKRKLNYLVSVADSQRQIHHNNMVNWVIGNAVSAFGAKQESEVLDDCIASIKQLASKNANVI